MARVPRAPAASTTMIRGDGLALPASARFAHWLHECVVESKLGVFPIYLLLPSAALLPPPRETCAQFCEGLDSLKLGMHLEKLAATLGAT